MKQVPINIFGSLGFLCSAEAGEHYDVPLNADGSYGLGIYYFYIGESHPTVIATGEALSPRTSGWLNTEHIAPAKTCGTLRSYFPVKTFWVCIPKAFNKGILPNVKSVHLAPGEVLTNEEAAKFFLCKGTLNDISGPAAIKLPDELTAISEVFGLLFLEN